jgi:hypothetical protein
VFFTITQLPNESRLNAALKKYITMFATQPSYIGLSSNVEIGLSEEPISFFEKYSENPTMKLLK